MRVLNVRRAICPVLIILAVAPLIAQRDVIRARVDLVVVPTSVRDGEGKLVFDLAREDFQIFEDDRRQEIANLSIDPVPLSVVLLVDTGMGGTALSRFAESIVSLTEGLTDVDELEAYRFDHIVMKLSDFTSNHEELEKKLGIIKTIAKNRPNRPAPIRIFPGRGPRWLRWLLGNSDPSLPYKNLNDPIFASSLDLDKRPLDRRKIIVVVSDGQVNDDASPISKGSTVYSLEDTRNRLIQRQIQLYGVALGNALFEGRTSILHAYANTTGGDVYPARTQKAMDDALSQILVQARHQYVLSYVSNNEVGGLLATTRKIEVKVNRPSMKVNHRTTYLQFPTPKQ